MNPEIDGQGINDTPDLSPINIPDQEVSPSIEDRISRVEDVLHIN